MVKAPELNQFVYQNNEKERAGGHPDVINIMRRSPEIISVDRVMDVTAERNPQRD